MKTDYPPLSPESVRDARLYGNREDMIRCLGIPRGAPIAEVGVAHGEFSEFLIETLAPSQFYAVDLFEMEQIPIHWGTPQEVLFQGKSHLDFYRSRFARLGSRLTLLRGDSAESARSIPDKLLALAYIDAGHKYENVAADAAVCVQKVRPDGFLIFNDYVVYDPFIDEEYGVVAAVNELVAKGEWCIVGFALQKHMFCDIALRRRGFIGTAFV